MKDNERSLEVLRQSLQSPGTTDLISRGLRDLTRPTGRIVRFLPWTSIGSVYVSPADEEPEDWYYWDWQRVGDARGDVQIPANEEVWLKLHWPQVLIGGLSDQEREELEQQPGVVRTRDYQDGPVLRFPHDDGFDLSFLRAGDIGFLSAERTDCGCLHEREFRALSQLSDLKGLEISGQDVSGAQLEILTGMRQLTALSLRGAYFTDDDLKNIRRLNTLRELNLSGPYNQGMENLTDAGLIWLQDLVQLRDLDLSRTKITNEGISHLRGLANLERINLGYTNVSDGCLWYLRSAQRLWKVDLSRTNMTDVGLRHLAQFPRLVHVDLNDLPISDAGLGYLFASCPWLGWLNLFRTRVSDAGLRYIAEMTGLVVLDLSFTHITDKGVIALTALPNLRELFLGGTAISPSMISSLQKAMPECRIFKSY